MALTTQEIEEYLKENKAVVLATTGEEGQPDLRTLGGYNFDGYTLYFGSAATANKVNQIANNSKVSVLVQHEGQVIPNYKNITLYGVAEKLTGLEYEKGKKIIQERRPNAEFDENVKSIFKVTPKKIKVLDFSVKSEDKVAIINL